MPASFVPADAPGEAAARCAPSRGVQISRYAAVLLCGGLTGLCAAWELWWVPTGQGSLALKALPLLFALRGLWRLRLYTYRWLSLAVWLYVAEGLVRATSETGPGALPAVLEVLFGTALFVACGIHVRLRLAAGRRLGAASPEQAA